jgi:hypothetical protein
VDDVVVLEAPDYLEGKEGGREEGREGECVIVLEASDEMEGREGGRENERVFPKTKNRKARKEGREGGKEENAYLHDGIAFADVGQEFVAQPFALRGPFDQARDVHEL